MTSQAHTAAVSEPDDGPRWRTVAIVTVVAGLALLPLITEGVALYLYAFPLFGLGIPYVIQFRASITRAWWVTFVAITPLSVVALALEWPFSGHVLWNVLFIAHAKAVVRSRVWTWVFVGSMVHLLTLKAVFQTPRDMVGAVLSAAVAGVILLVLWRLDGTALLTTTHGRLVLAKVVLLGVMLWMADRNRRLVLARFQPELLGAADVTVLRRMMWRELALGVVVLGVTASLVVQPPG